MPLMPNPNPPGIPRTEEQRKAEHRATYGTEKLPPRGSGFSNPGATPEEAAQVAVEALKEREIRNYEALAALETIRVNQFMPFNLHEVKSGSVDTSSETLYLDAFEPGYIYVITSISAVEIGSGTPQIKIGVRDGVTNFIYESATVGNAEDSVEYVGQLMCKETDKIFATFESATASDTIHIFVNGYKIKR